MSTKRKRSEDPAEHAPNPNATTRRTTRHTAVQPPVPPPVTTVPIPLPPTFLQTSALSTPPPLPPAGRRRSSASQSQPNPLAQLPSPQVLRWAPPEVPGPTKPPHAAAMGSIATKYNSRPSDLVAPEITYHVPQAAHPTQRTSALVRPHGPTVQPPRLDRVPPTITPVFPPRPPASAPERPPPRADRNIDKVVFGNLCFRTWYPSYYGKEVLGDSGATRGGSKDGGKDTGGKSSSKKEREHHTMLERLYVCPSCFKYSKELVAWWGHVRVCEVQRYIPGRKIYVHPQGRRKVLVPAENKGSGPKKRRGDSGVRYVEEIVQDEGEWSIWEVDGEKDGVSSIQNGRLPKYNADMQGPALLPESLIVCEALPR